MIIFLLQNIPVILLALLITIGCFNHLGLVDMILCSALLYFSYIVLVQQVLGLFGVLTAENLLVVNLVVLSALFMILRYKKPGWNFAAIPKIANFKEFGKLNILLVSLIAGFALVKLSINLINPPFGWDSLNYHFTFAAEWLKNKNLGVPIVVSDNPCPSYYPLNGCLIYLWYMFPFKNVFLADLGQAPFFIIVLFCVYNICRKLNVSSQLSFFAAVLMAATPNFFKQLSIAYVDLMVCAWFLMGLNFLLELQDQLNLKNMLLFGLSIGMLIGTKTIALAYAAIPVAFFIYFMLRKKGNPAVIIQFFVFLFAVLSVGSFWYIKNINETGNPLYPLTLKLFGKVVFSGVMGKESFTAFSGSRDYSLEKILFHEGLGSAVLLFLIPGVIIFMFSLIKRRKIAAKEAVLASVLVGLFAIYNSVFSLPNVRYLYSLIAVGYITAFYALASFNFPKRILNGLIIVCVAASLPEMARRQELAWALMISAVLFAILSVCYKSLIKHFPSVLLACLCLGLFILGFESIDYRKNEFKRYVLMVKYSGFWPDAAKAWEWLNNNTKGNNIAYIGRPVPFPLYGADLKNNVYYVSVNKIDPVKLHYFPNAKYHWGADYLSLHNNLEEQGNYRENADYKIWLSNLKKRNTDFIFVYSLHQTKETVFPLEDIWAKAHTEEFDQAFANAAVHIYKIKT